MQTLKRINEFLNRLLIWIGGVFLVCMILITCANIFFRVVWVPVRGTFELMGFFGALVAAFSLGYTQQRKGHIAVDVLLGTFSPGVRRILAVVNSFICLVFFGIVAWQLILKANTLRMSGEVTETLRIIYYPFTYAVALGCIVLSFALLSEFIQTLWGEKGDGTS